MVASKLPGEGPIADGVYDSKGLMLRSSLALSKRMLRNSQSRLFLIYSDLSKNLGLEKVSVEEICRQEGLIIAEKK